MQHVRWALLIAFAAASGCIAFGTELGGDECVVVPGAGGVGCAAAEGVVRDAAGRPMAAVSVYFGGSPTPGRVGVGVGEQRIDHHVTEADGRYRIRTVLQGAQSAVLPDTASVWVVAVRIDTLPSGVTVNGPRDSIAVRLRFGPAGPTTPKSDVPTITLPDRWALRS